VVRVLGYRFGGPGSIPGTTRLSEEKKKENKWWVWNGVHSASGTEELLDKNVAAPV
jgi:hypothetical protein